METNPIVPRQRNRRADRHPAEPAPEALTPQAEAQPVRVQRVEYGQARAEAAPVPQPEPARQSPMVTVPQPRQAAPDHPQTQGGYQLPQPSQPAPRPRTIQQRTAVNSGWQQPTVQIQSEPVPQPRGFVQTPTKPARPAREEEEDVPAKDKAVPRWLTTALSLCFVAVLALVAAYYLMQAYLVTEENRRAAAYEAVLNNYHITEQADGTLRVTWQDTIEHYAAQYNLQPAFVTAIIRNESSFRTNAESGVGARGLMQMMPDTAEWIAGKLDDDGYTFDSMWDAETNIRYGCWYLGYLSRLFNGDAELVSAAYHAGQTTVTQWLSDRTKSPDGVHLDLTRLSDGPTKQYIGRVTQTYGIYQTLLYPDAVPADGVPAAPGR